MTDLTLLSEAAAKELEPELAGSAVRGALLSPSSGIVSVAGLRAALRAEVKNSACLTILASAGEPTRGGSV